MFLHIPKTAGQFIRYFLRSFKKTWVTSGSHVTYDQEIKDGTKPYILVRNPWDWYVSRWSYYQKYNNRQFFNNMTFVQHLNSLVNFDVGLIHKEARENHKEFLWKCKTLNDWHLYMSCGQTVQIFKMEDIIETVKSVSKLENIDIDDKEIEKFCKQRINCVSHPNYRTYYDEESKELVRQYDKEIVEKFNYSF